MENNWTTISILKKILYLLLLMNNSETKLNQILLFVQTSESNNGLAIQEIRRASSLKPPTEATNTIVLNFRDLDPLPLTRCATNSVVSPRRSSVSSVRSACSKHSCISSQKSSQSLDCNHTLYKNVRWEDKFI